MAAQTDSAPAPEIHPDSHLLEVVRRYLEVDKRAKSIDGYNDPDLTREAYRTTEFEDLDNRRFLFRDYLTCMPAKTLDGAYVHANMLLGFLSQIHGSTFSSESRREEMERKVWRLAWSVFDYLSSQPVSALVRELDAYPNLDVWRSSDEQLALISQDEGAS